ncbi:MAG: hypothetical protein B0D87_02365 [Candidatus Sedimenticola endophacoides]|nr:MAG: hypothetical protein B0D94_11090 [Candidatus Sedimenticola endophacoides]OQX41098.1 MAG: hypothetical protein B0D82_02590 [Candidatus Sedimenticola endophacoides]OQX42539.1 MAG: hypothetical protein B0D89_01055 [Candidatus Sedimenticola endophacoides]OQX44047.1 MAG: hypothetical protein B0D86_06480 [Candidatus Sedimenticola endophacoides]OQX49067.1 MAG: hypothetical protein B0D87_02365 [Candidatus Sedimenticola endophacoides]
MTPSSATGSTMKQAATRYYLSLITLLISLVVASSFLGFTFRTNALFDTLLLEEARAFDKEVSLLRGWVMGHGGIYVVDGDHATRPTRRIIGQGGEVLTQRNASEVVSELSRLSRDAGIVRFGAIALTPINPLNRADAFEREGLERLRAGAAEVHEYQDLDGRRVYRYLSPLLTERKCLGCHEDGSFQAGRVDGALSFILPADAIENQKRLNWIWMSLSGLSVILLIGLMVWVLSRRFIRKLSEADRRLEQLAAEDMLTGLFNRRYGMERLETELARCRRRNHPLSLAMIDIDHFKRINDTLGHMAGDHGLAQLAATLRSQLRRHDIAFRYGGEEFVLILPETDADQALQGLERLRARVEGLQVRSPGQPDYSLTISIGIAQWHPAMSGDTLLERADRALYAAKEEGRNRCRVHAP